MLEEERPVTHKHIRGPFKVRRLLYQLEKGLDPWQTSIGEWVEQTSTPVNGKWTGVSVDDNCLPCKQTTLV